MSEENELKVPKDVVNEIRTRYEVDQEFFKELQFFRLNRSFIHVLPSKIEIPQEIRTHTLGVPFVKLSLKTPKLTTQGAQLIGPHANKNVIEFSESEVSKYLQRIPVKKANYKKLDDGYILISFDRQIIGTGVWKPDTETVLSQWPKQLSFIKG